MLTLPSTSGGLPMGMIDAMGRNVVPANSGVGGRPEIVHDRVNGVIGEHRDVSALSRDFERLAGGPSLRARLSAAARDTVKPLDTRVYGLALEQLCRRALANHGGAS